MKRSRITYRNIVLLFLVISVVLTSLLFLRQRVKVEGSPISKSRPAVTIDKGTSFEYVVEKDAIGKEEVEMPLEYVQSPGYFYRFKKDWISAYGEPFYSYGGYSRTNFQNKVPINDKYDALLFFGYGWGTTFAGVSALMVDKQGNIMKDSDGKQRVVRSSPTGNPSFPLGSAHQAGAGELIRYQDGNFGLLTGPYNEVGVYVKKFDEEFNVVEDNVNIAANSTVPVFPMTPYGGYSDENNLYLQTHSFNSNGLAYVYKVSKKDSEILERIDWEIPLAANLISTFGTFESKIEFGGYDRNNQFVETVDGGYVGPVGYLNSQSNRSTFAIAKWDKNRKLEYWSQGSNNIYANSTIDILTGISNQKYFYYWINGEVDTSAKLIRVDLEENYTISANKKIEPEVVKELPKESSLQLQYEQATDTYFFEGYLSELTNEFESLGVKEAGIVIGQMDLDFNVISAQSIGSKGKTSFKSFDFDAANPKKIFVTGDTRSIDFIDEEFQEIYKGKDFNSYFQLGFWGEMTVFKNYKPGIKLTPSVTVDVDVSKVATERNQILLAGVEVKDIFDTDHTENGGNQSQDWLNKRVNRNPNKIDAEIDWKGLGLNLDEPGPYQTKYFIVDSTLQQTSSSRLVNVVNKYTEYDKVGALTANNFDVNVKNVEHLEINTNLQDSDNVLGLSKTKAWLQDSGVLETNDLNKVSVNQAELATIQKAKIEYDLIINDFDKSSVLKPYPLTFSYEYKSGTTISKTIQVYVVDDKVTVEKDKNILIYAFDYELGIPTQNQVETKQSSFEHSFVKVYSYKEGMVIADENQTNGLDVDDVELNNIKKLSLPQKSPLTFSYFDGINTITNTVNVNLIYAIADITVFFKDEDGDKLAEPIVIKGELIGSKYDLTANQDVQDIVEKLEADWYVVQRPLKETEIEVEKTGSEITYIFKGLIGFKSVTSKMTFEKGYIYPFSQTLEYKSSEDFKINILDNRGTLLPAANFQRGQFKINATLTVPFTNKGATTNKILTDANLIYNDGTTDHEINNTGANVYSSTLQSNERNYEIKLDENGDVSSKGLSLKIPAGTGLELGKYSAEITWDLIQGP